MKELKVGDKVKIRNNLTDDEKGTCNPGYIERMNEYLGKIGEITYIDMDGDLQLDIDDGYYYWSPDWVTPIESEDYGEFYTVIDITKSHTSPIGSYSQACKEAKELAKESPDNIFYVAKTLCSFNGETSIKKTTF